MGWMPRATAERPSTAIRLRIASLIVFWSVITIAVLNPLLCLFHCAFSRPPSALGEAQRHFLCDLDDSTPSFAPAPFAAVWSGPRAVYEALPVTQLRIVVVMMLVAVLVNLPLRGSQHITLPDRPPPKLPLQAIAV